MNSLRLKLFGVAVIFLLILVIANFFINYTRAPVLIFFVALVGSVFFVRPIFFLILYSALLWVPYFLGGRFLPGFVIPEACIYLNFLLYIISEVARKRNVIKNILETPFLVPLVLFSISGLFVLLFAHPADRLTAVMYFRGASVYPMLVYIIFVKLIKTGKEAENIMAALALGGLIMGALAFFLHRGYVGVEYTSHERLGGEYLAGGINFWFHPIGLATHLSSIFPISVILWMSSKRKIVKLIGLCSAPAILFFIIMSGTRTAWMACFAGLLCVIMLGFKYKQIKLHMIILLSSVGLIVFSIIAMQQLLSPEVSRRVESFQNKEVMDSFDTRLEKWQGAMKHIWEQPMGMGYSSIYPYCGFDSPHNLFLAIALGSGVFGLMVFFWFILRWLILVFRRLRDSTDEEKLIYLSGIGSLIALLINGIGDVPIYYGSNTFVLIFIVFGCSVAIASRKNEPTPVS
ncbi:MAG: O-antigen ligase family protein [Candidatus Omnitrophica bacterium]|nr:O-antigen ligase family protein [Candidatus Omnitrophota bacterium]